jgi:nanoRNase/pAp phosphatase (c-di-AMP/oligoRNAs hydrolase)
MLSNELLFLYPNKIIIVAREKSDELMLSIRSSDVNVEDILSKSLEGVNGYGGGHNNACGACIKSDNFDVFFEQFKSNLLNKLGENK